jgi:hypothetical protein
MRRSTLAGFRKIFVQKFFPSLKEKLVHAILMLGALAYAYKKGKASEQFWEIVAPPVWVLSLILAWHAITTAVRLRDELKEEKNIGLTERELSILLPSGKPAKVTVPPDVVPYYGPKVLGIVLMLCLLAFIPSYVVWQRIRAEAVPAISEPFSATVGATFLNPKRNQIPGWWLGDLPENGTTGTLKDIRHASVVVYVTATNLQSVESLIRYYGLQVKTEEGEWVDLRHVDPRGAATFLVFENTGLRVSHLCKIPDLFDMSIRPGKIIKPGEIFKGWAFFEYPRKYTSETFVPIFRFTLHDMRGLDYVSGEQHPDINRPRFELQGGSIIPVQHMDLSGVPIFDEDQ